MECLQLQQMETVSRHIIPEISCKLLISDSHPDRFDERLVQLLAAERVC